MAALRDAWWWETPDDQTRSPVETPDGVAIIRGLFVDTWSWHQRQLPTEGTWKTVKFNKLCSIKLYNCQWSVCCSSDPAGEFQYCSPNLSLRTKWNLVLMIADECWKWYHYVVTPCKLVIDWNVNMERHMMVICFVLGRCLHWSVSVNEPEHA